MYFLCVNLMNLICFGNGVQKVIDIKKNSPTVETMKQNKE